MELIDAREEEKEELQQALVQLAKKHKLRRKLITVVIIVAVFLVSILSAWLVGNIQAKKNHEASSQKEIERLMLALQEKEQELIDIRNTPVVVNRIAPEIALDIINSELKSIGELATTEYVFTDAAVFTDSKDIAKWNWNIPGTEKSFITKWDGKIKAGIQIDKITIDIDETNYRILITLPDAEVFSYETFNVEILDEKNNIFNPISIEDKNQQDEKAKEEMIDRAIENGLLDMAQKNAEGVIASLLCVNPDITGNYTIEFTQQ